MAEVATAGDTAEVEVQQPEVQPVAPRPLIWKQLLKTGRWFKFGMEGEKIAIDITGQMLAQIKEAFDRGVVPHVPVPCQHTDNLRANTGFAKALEIRGSEQWVGLEFTEPDIEALVLRGTIANVSAWISPNYIDSRDGRAYPWVLRHVALTNEPVIHLTPFAAGVESTIEEIYRPEVGEVENEKLLAQLEDLKGKLAEEQKARSDLGVQLSAAEAARTASESRVEAMALTLHQSEVKNIMLALQGKGIHDAVKLPPNTAFAPAILSVVKPILEADHGHEKSFSLSVGDGQKESVTGVVLSILNAVAGVKLGLIELSAHGASDQTPPGGKEKTEPDKAKDVESYLASRHLV